MGRQGFHLHRYPRLGSLVSVTPGLVLELDDDTSSTLARSCFSKVGKYTHIIGDRFWGEGPLATTPPPTNHQQLRQRATLNNARSQKRLYLLTLATARALALTQGPLVDDVYRLLASGDSRQGSSAPATMVRVHEQDSSSLGALALPLVGSFYASGGCACELPWAKAGSESLDLFTGYLARRPE